jgi:tRNA A-37 threonylcarbamoyl transferase component Bud32
MSKKLRTQVCERVAFTLNVSPKVTNVERGKLDNWRLCMHCSGSSMGMRFFAKVFLGELYRFDCPSMVPTEEAIYQHTKIRSVEEQIETEWNATNQLRALAGPVNVPVPAAKSHSAKTIVWEEVGGKRMDHFVAWSRLRDAKGSATAAAMFSAGAWLRKVHDAFPQGREEELDISRLIETMPNLVQGEPSYKHARIATKLLERALVIAGGTGKLLVPIGFTHGDFSLSNLLWDTKRTQLSVIDFENCGYRSICHDLAAIVFSLRGSLLHPLIPKPVVLSSEKSFWAGYGQITSEMFVCVDALVSSRIFCGVLYRLRTRSKRRGWLAGLTALAYRAFLEDYVITRRLGIPAGFGDPR